jgi:mRNA interferase YafQ
MFQVIITNKFKKDVKLLHKRGYDMGLLKKVIIQFEEKGKLPITNKPHKLSGDLFGFWEAHIKPDWLIIWKVFDNKKEIWLTRTGTHSDLF